MWKWDSRTVVERFGAFTSRSLVKRDVGKDEPLPTSTCDYTGGYTGDYTGDYTLISRFSNSIGHDWNTALSFLEIAHPMPSNGPCPSSRPP